MYKCVNCEKTTLFTNSYKNAQNAQSRLTNSYLITICEINQHKKINKSVFKHKRKHKQDHDCV
jgi:hypothetical protein